MTHYAVEFTDHKDIAHGSCLKDIKDNRKKMYMKVILIRMP